MSRRSLLLAVLLAAIALAPALAQEKPAEKAAGTPAQQFAPKPAEKSLSATQDFSKEAYIIERFATHIVAENDGTGTRELTAQVKVLAEAGVKAFAVLDFVYTSANEAVVCLDGEGVITEWNRGAEAIFGRDPASLVGESFAAPFANPAP